MMNNPWFRVAIHSDVAGALRFEHPTQAGVLPGGWMQRLKDQGRDILKPEFKDVSAPVVKLEKKVEVKMTNDAVKRTITVDELKAHNSPDQPWFVVNGEGGPQCFSCP